MEKNKTLKLNVFNQVVQGLQNKLELHFLQFHMNQSQVCIEQVFF